MALGERIAALPVMALPGLVLGSLAQCDQNQTSSGAGAHAWIGRPASARRPRARRGQRGLGDSPAAATDVPQTSHRPAARSSIGIFPTWPSSPSYATPGVDLCSLRNAQGASATFLKGRQIDTVHIVGGGARNPLLCQLTTDACRLPVVARPVEAAALGNILVQARTLGAAPASLDGIRSLVHATQRQRRFKPAASNTRAWETAARRVTIAE
jgi:hypothetical protein